MPYDEFQAAMAIAKLQEENRELREQLRQALERGDRCAGELEQLKKRLEELEREAARQAAPFRRRERKKVDPARKKRPGRKAGHPGAYRSIPDHVDEEIEVSLCCCPQCGGDVQNAAPLTQYIEELPPVRPHVTRLVTWSAECPTCGEVRSTHPLQTSVGQGAAKVQLGPRALALAALLNKKLGLTMRKTCRVLRDLAGLTFTPGGLAQSLARVAGKVEAEYVQLREQVRTSQAVFVDETSWWVGGPGWWLWVFTTPQGITFYHVDKGRGSQVVREVLGDDFAGILVSDCLSSYDPVNYRKHKCIAHHLQAIKKARERPDTKDLSYLDAWTELFQHVIALYHHRDQCSAEEFAEQRSAMVARVDELLNRPVLQSGDVAVQNRLLKQHAHLLGCLHDPAAEPTNNRAERTLRSAVIARKLSCGNKTEAGRQVWQILASLAATCDGLAIDFVDFLAARLPLAVQAG
jgi:transposase